MAYATVHYYIFVDNPVTGTPSGDAVSNNSMPVLEPDIKTVTGA